MVDSVTDARKRQIARLDGARPPTARKAMALANSKAYQDGADAEATLRAYATDVAHFALFEIDGALAAAGIDPAWLHKPSERRPRSPLDLMRAGHTGRGSAFADPGDAGMHLWREWEGRSVRRGG